MAERARTYGLTVAEVIDLLKNQDNECAICKTDITFTFHVDHCHDSLRVRGLLCPSCNIGVGHFRNSPDFLRAAAKYLD